jgi:type 2A phosphatase activator TIP41
VTSRKSPIIGSPLLEEYSDRLGGVLTLPEILFGNSSLQLRHDASGVTLRFTAFEALQQWKADDLPPLKVPVAKQWQASRQQEIEQQQALVLDYDWTYTTSYAGSLCIQPAASKGSSSGNSGSSGTSSDAAGSADQTTRNGLPAAGSAAAASGKAEAGAAADAAAAATAGGDGGPSTSSSAGLLPEQGSQQQQQQQLPAWQPSSRQIDRHMLMSTSEPILFYAEVPLYESELDDNGVCQLTVKVGVPAARGGVG